MTTTTRHAAPRRRRKAFVLSAAAATGVLASTLLWGPSGTYSLWRDSATMSATTNVASLRWTLDLSADAGQVSRPDQVGWTLTVRNDGTTSARPTVTLTGTGLGSLSDDPWATASSDDDLAGPAESGPYPRWTWTAQELAPGESATLRLGADHVTADTGWFTPYVTMAARSNCTDGTEPGCTAPVEVVYDYANVGTVTGKDDQGDTITDDDTWSTTVHPSDDDTEVIH